MALGFFTPTGNPNVDMETRRKIALAMMMRGRKAFPKNLGEGIASVGQEIGDYLAERSLLEQNAAENKAADEFKSKYTGEAPQAAPAETMPPAVAAASIAPPTPSIVPAPPPQARTIAPPVPGTPGTPLPPDQQQTYEPNAITRMPGRPGRSTAVVPDIAPGQPGNTGADTFLPPGPLSTPVMAQGGVPADVPPAEEARRAIAHAELRRQMGGASPPAPPAPAVPQRPTVADYGQPSALAPTPQAIPAAPPQQQIRAMPSPPVVQGPQIVDPGPEPTPGRTTTDLQRQILQDLDKEPPATRANARAAVEPILQQEQAKIAQEQAVYNHKRALWEARMKMRDEQVYGAPKEAASTAKTLQEIEDARKPKVQKLEGDEYERNPQTGVYEPVRTSANPDRAPPLPKNEFQLKSLKHYEQMQEAEKNVGEGKALRQGLSVTGSQVPIVGGYLQSDAYRKERSAAERWVINKLRPESGAVLGEKEIDREVKNYFPQPSDDEKTIANKNAARKIANEGMMEASGREGKNYLEWKNKQAAIAEAAKAKEVAEAVQWLKDNKDDPRAAAVRKRLGL